MNSVFFKFIIDVIFFFIIRHVCFKVFVDKIFI